VPFKLMGMCANDGYITNLPGKVRWWKVPIYADGTGLHPTVSGDLPPSARRVHDET